MIYHRHVRMPARSVYTLFEGLCWYGSSNIINVCMLISSSFATFQIIFKYISAICLTIWDIFQVSLKFEA